MSDSSASSVFSLHDAVLAIIDNRDGKLISVERITSKQQYVTVQCEEQHEWSGRVDHFLEGCWCKYCSQPNRLNIKALQDVAQSREGRLISTIYQGTKAYYTWECKNEHQWEAQACNVLYSGRWCWECLKFNIDMIRDIAKQRGGVCLTGVYTPGCRLMFRCSENHEWETSLQSIQHGSWCRYCNQSRTERICRAILEMMFGVPFPSVRPAWLRGEKGRSLELDCYNEELNIALEFQGRQHYKDVEFYGNILAEIQQRDALKAQQCQDRGVPLLVISYETQLADLYPTIVGQCAELDIEIPEHHEINVDRIKLTPRTQERLVNLQTRATEKGGLCLSLYYINNYTKLLFRCRRGHEWRTTPAVITSGSWCPHCHPNALTEEIINERLKDTHVRLAPNQIYQRSKQSMSFICLIAKEAFIDTYDKLSSRMKRSGRVCKLCK